MQSILKERPKEPCGMKQKGGTMKRFLAIFGLISLMVGWLWPTSIADAAVRDCDSNAVIYCGAATISELNQKIKNGTGKPYQSGAELTKLFAKYGYHPDDDAKYLREGYVTNKNEVYVYGIGRVATNVRSMGRSYMPGSSDVPGISYPLWYRYPSISFRSSKLDAWVYLNYDKSLRYAIIKSCGNIVPGAFKRAPSGRLNIVKFEDLNLDGRKQSNERGLHGWNFEVSGPNNYRIRVTTGTDGVRTLNNLVPGSYTIREIPKTGWHNTTPLTQRVSLASTRTVYFGNVEYVRLTIWKYEDIDQDGNRDSNEPFLSDWEFDVSGPQGYQSTVRTGDNGAVTISRLLPGNYTITERQRENWRATTDTVQSVNLLRDSAAVYFGNARVYEVRDLVALNVAKFYDSDADGIRDSGERMLSGWSFRISGPNGYRNTITTGENGIATLENLEPGSYIVTEVLREGWENTTGLTISREVTTDESTQTFVFGNRETKEEKKSGGEPKELPKSGPEDAAAAFGAFGLSGSILAWIRSKKALLKSILKK